MEKPKIYLNLIKFENQNFIRLLYKSNSKITKIIKNNDWIEYIPELKSYCVKYTDKNINIIKDLFFDIATINTYYLHSTPTIKADDIIINKEIYFNEVLPYAKKLDTILLLPYNYSDKKIIIIKYKYSTVINIELRKVKYIDWDKDLKSFYFLAKKSLLKNFIRKYSEIFKINIHHKLIINDIGLKKLLFEQNYKKTYYFKSCPDIYLEKMYAENKSINTITTYHNLLLRFINTYKNCSLEKINNFTEDQINKYHLNMKESSNCSAATLNQSVNAIKYYYNSVLGKGLKYQNFIRPKREKKLPSYYSKEEITKIINSIENIKHKAMIMLMFSGGLRISELLNLKAEDILSDVKQIHIRKAKGRKERYTILSDKALRTLREYYKEFKPKEYLFEGQYGGKYSASSFRNVLAKAIKKSGVTKKGSSHVLRHTFATLLLQSGVDIRYIQELLGHNSSKTTEIYTHVVNKEIQKIKSPLDNLDI